MGGEEAAEGGEAGSVGSPEVSPRLASALQVEKLGAVGD